MRLLSFLCFFFLLQTGSRAQEVSEVAPPSYIRTLIFQGNSEFTGPPVIKLGEGLRLEFDDIIGDEANYFYTIQHFNYDWTPSQLAKSEFLEGFDDVRISNYENSYNTLQPYSHYSLSLPNRDMQGFKVSGNYMLNIFNENRELVFSRKFMVYEPRAQVAVEIRRSRDLNYIHTRQVVHFKVVPEEQLILRNPAQNVRALILQNNNLKTAITNITPQYTTGNDLIYKYDQETSFWGGNEYLSFDSKDLRAASINIQHVEVRDLYHHFLYKNEVRATRPYTYNPDINGNFVIRTTQGNEPEIEAEYVWTHFFLETPNPIEDGEIHLYGHFNNFNLDESTRLTYNPAAGGYETARLFKQGFYNYKYVVLKNNGEIEEGEIGGNFDTTENEYRVLIYYLPVGGRYDRIIGSGSATSTDIKN